jgi:tripartite-type tricarboxylate transporter receptor subunit TctC
MAGIDVVHVPHKGSAEARTDVLAGNVQMMFDAITTMAPLVQSGKVRAIATSGKTRSSITPNVPTLNEAGLPGYDAVIWLGMMAPAGTPKPIIEALNTDIQKIANAPDVKDAWAKQGAVPMHMSAEEFGKFMEQDIQKWAKVVKFSGARVD